MKFRLLRPRDLAQALRELARRHPEEAEQYLDTHLTEWGALADAVPHDAADILEALPDDSAADLIVDLDPDDAGDVLDEMAPESAADLLEELTPTQAADLISEMTPTQAADVVGELDDPAPVLAQLSEPMASAVERLLQHAADSAGGLMITEVATLPIGMTAGEAIEALRRLSEEATVSYVYVIDDDGRLQGVVSFRDLVFSRPGTGLDEVMVANPVKVRTDTDREIVSELIQRYHLLAVPVVDEADRLVGVVTVGDAIQAVAEEATEDIAALVGAGAEETVFTPVRVSVRRRLPWILTNMVIGFVLATVIARFEGVVERNAVLVAYLPIAPLLGGNSGAQSLAVIIRALALGHIPARGARQVILREAGIGLTNGLVMAIVTGVIGALFSGSTEVGIVVAVAVFIGMIVASVVGSGIPLLLERLGQDPALAANIFLTMFTDLVGFGAYLLTAALLL